MTRQRPSAFAPLQQADLIIFVGLLVRSRALKDFGIVERFALGQTGPYPYRPPISREPRRTGWVIRRQSV